MRDTFSELLHEVWGRVIPRRSGKFILLSQGRAGGTTFLRMLGTHPSIRYFDEPLSRKVGDPLRLIEGYASRYALKKKVWGCKIKHWHITRIQGRSDGAAFFREAIGAGWVFIYLRRDNFVKQAIAALAREYGNGLDYHCDPTVRVHIPTANIEQAIVRTLRYRSEEEELVRSLSPITISYEKDLLAPARRQAACDRVLRALALPSIQVPSNKLPTDPDRLSAFVSNAREVEAMLRTLGYSYNQASASGIDV